MGIIRGAIKSLEYSTNPTTSMYRIFKHVTSGNSSEWVNAHEPVVDCTAKLEMDHGSQGNPFMRISDLTHALRKGKKCVRYRIEAPFGTDYVMANLIHDFGTLATLFKILEGFTWGGFNPIKVEHAGMYFTVYRGHDESNRKFTPLSVGDYKPLKREPKRWNVRLACRALLNGQFQDLKCEGRYSDDYQFDAASNYGKGKISHGVAFAKRIITSPSGWRAYDGGDGRVAVCCHSFDTNSFVFDLEGTLSPSERVFIGHWSTGIQYCDRTREEDGDYKKLAFLPHDSRLVQWQDDCPDELKDFIQNHATHEIEMRRPPFSGHLRKVV